MVTLKKLSDDERNNLRLKRDKYIEPYLYKIDGKKEQNLFLRKLLN